MSHYLRFVLGRFGAPIPERIVILRHQHDWANQQLLDEFKFQFPDSSVNLTQVVNLNDSDLFVLPYLHNFFVEVPGGRSLYARLKKKRYPWVMLYGLGYRKIAVMPANKLLAYYRRGRGFHRLTRLIRFLGLVSVIRKIRFLLHVG